LWRVQRVWLIWCVEVFCVFESILVNFEVEGVEEVLGGVDFVAFCGFGNDDVADSGAGGEAVALGGVADEENVLVGAECFEELFVAQGSSPLGVALLLQPPWVC
jgi:hypothetical protein